MSDVLMERIASGAERPGRYQVRFWASPDLYEDFRQKCDNAGVTYQHAFNEFMKWYVDYAQILEGTEKKLEKLRSSSQEAKHEQD